jgi:hypothetical protein
MLRPAAVVSLNTKFTLREIEPTGPQPTEREKN